MEQKIDRFEKLKVALKSLSFGKVLEIKCLTKGEVDKLFSSYSRDYIVRGPLQDSQETKYSLYFELNPYKKGGMA